MAVIGYIRKHSAIAVILVGISLVAFLVGPNLIDWAKNVLGYSSGPGAKREIGIINGQTFTLSEFENLTLKNVELTKLNQQKPDLTASEIYEIKNQTWSQRINEIIMQEEYDKLGLTISQDEMIDLLRGNNPHRLIRQYFVNENGVYDPNRVVQYMQNVDQLPPQDRAQWENFKEFIFNDRLTTKYRTLIRNGYYLPRALAEMEYHNESDIVSFRYVGLNYSKVPDTLVPETTEAQYKALYEEVKHQYLQNDTRSIEFVVFNILPSEKDLREIEDETMEIFTEWKRSNDPAEFVNNIPGNRYDSAWYGRGELPVMLDSAMFAANIGQFVRPYKDGSSWFMARLMDRDVRPDSASAEHVLISYQGAFRADPTITRSKIEAEQLADSIYGVIRSDVTRLEAIAVEMSDDGSVANNNGNIGWFRDGQMVYAFNKAAIKGKPGDIVMIETPFGYHVIHVTGQTEAKERVRVALVEIPIEYSSETYDMYYADARKFAGENNTQQKFNQAVIDEGLEKREGRFLREMQEDIPGLENSRQIVRWAFWDDRKLGDVSQLFDVSGKLVVALLTSATEKGDITFEEMKERMAIRVVNDRKADYIKDKIKTLGTNDIYVIAQAFDARVDTNQGLGFNSRNIPGYGAENSVIGGLFAVKEGENSDVLRGNAAIFMAEVDRVYRAPVLEDYTSVISKKKMNFESLLNNNLYYQALENNADIKDYRRYFY